MGLFATLDVEWPEDYCYKVLYDQARHWPLYFERIVCWAKRANDKGRVLRSDGAPMDANSMAYLADGKDPSYAIEWAEFLKQAVSLGLLNCSDGCYQIAHWKRWHRSPSDEPELVRERVARHRENVRSQSQATVTKCNECNDTEQSRAEQSIAEQSTPPSPLSGDGEGKILLQPVDSMEDEAVAVRLRALDKLSARLDRKLRSAERRKAEELLSRRTPAGLTVADWHRVLSEAFSAHFRQVVDEANSGKRIGSIVAIACARTEEQLSAHLIASGRTA